MLPRIFQQVARSAPGKSHSNLNGLLCLYGANYGSLRYFTIHRPEMKTLEFQDRLGNLPVPDLQETVARFLKTAQPHLSKEEFEETTRKMNEFAKPGGIGEQLRLGLVERSKKFDNWFADWWLDMAYLEYRECLPVWSSPGFAYPVRKFNSLQDQLEYAAMITAGALEYKVLLDKQLVPPDLMGDTPIDMSQYYMLFGANRRPIRQKDQLSVHTDSKHIIVAHNGHFFKVNVFANDGKPIGAKKVQKILERVVEKSQALGESTNVGILSSDNRDKWAEAYDILKSSHVGNAKSIDSIEKSLFLVCLDGSNDSFGRTSDPVARSALNALHGLGGRFNSSNRWFDKSLQFVIASNGDNGLTMEHSPADGVATVAISNYILTIINKNLSATEDLGANDSFEEPEHLQFVVNDELKTRVADSDKSLQALIDDLEMDVLIHKDYGKNFVKSLRFSPDSYVQMLIQYAFYKIHETPGAHYESGATRLFKRGRTEVIRSCSNASIKFAQAMMSSASKEVKFAAMSNAIRDHNEYMKNALRGHGVDRLFQGMKRLAIERNIPIPDVYDDPGYIRSARMRLSTSQISGKYLGTFASFGPLVTDGYGCCYSLHSDSFLFVMSSYSSNPVTSNQRFYESLQSCLKEMKDVAPIAAA